MKDDLTVTEAMADPLIDLVLKADGIDLATFASSLENAKKRFIDQGMERLRAERADYFYRQIDTRIQ
jgi:hypothetical protein